MGRCTRKEEVDGAVDLARFEWKKFENSQSGGSKIFQNFSIQKNDLQMILKAFTKKYYTFSDNFFKFEQFLPNFQQFPNSIFVSTLSRHTVDFRNYCFNTFSAVASRQKQDFERIFCRKTRTCLSPV